MRDDKKPIVWTSPTVIVIVGLVAGMAVPLSAQFVGYALTPTRVKAVLTDDAGRAVEVDDFVARVAHACR